MTPSGHGYNGSPYLRLGSKQLRSFYRDLHLGAGGEQRNIARTHGVNQHVCATCAKIFFRMGVRTMGRFFLERHKVDGVDLD